MLDTYLYLLDGAPLSLLYPNKPSDGMYSEVTRDAKPGPAEIFRNYPQFQLATLPSDLPAEYLQQLRNLLPFTPPNEAVADLAYASRDASGQLVIGPAVVNRPW